MADNVETQQNVNADDSSKWELAENSATSCCLPVTQTVHLTLELREPNLSSWAVYLRESGHFEFDMDFPRLHAMLRWLHEELWDCTTNFVLEHKLIQMADPLRYVAWSKEAYTLESTRWYKIDERELTDWTFLIGHTQVPDSAFLDGFTAKWGSVDSVKIFLRSADEIRHAAAHHRSISVGDFFQAMLLPRILKDTKRAHRIEKTCFAVCDEAGSFFDESTRMNAEQTIYNMPCETVRQKLARLESLLQKLCFSYAQRKAPHLLSSCCWVVPERVEISKLSDWRFQTLYQDDFPDERFDSESFHETVVALQHLRNQLWHRHPVSDTEFLYFFHAAVRFAIYTANRAGSINVEVEVEMMFTGKSREEILARLHRVYQAEELPTEEEDRRRECRRRVAIGKVLEESGIEMSSRETFTNWNYMFQYPKPEEPYWEEPFVEASGEPLEDLGDDVPWVMEDVVPAGTDLKETYPDDSYWEEGHADSEYIESDHADSAYIESDHADSEYIESDHPDSAYIDPEHTDSAYIELEHTDSDDPDTENPGSQHTDLHHVDSDHEDSDHQKTTMQETQAQPGDQRPLKEVQITVTNIDSTFHLLDSLPIQSKQTFDINPPSSTHSPTPTTPAAISQSNPSTTIEDKPNPPIPHDHLDLGAGRTPAFETPSTKSCERPRLLTFSPSMHECLKW